MSTLTDDQSSQGSSAEEHPVKKTVEDKQAKMNGMNGDSASVGPKENGVDHKSSSSGDGHHKSSKSSSSSSKPHGSASSSSSKHGSSSSSSSRHKDGHHSSSSSSKHRDGSSSKHSSSSSSSRSKEGSSSSSSHRDKDGKSSSSSSSKHKEGSASSSHKHSSGSGSSSSKHHSSSGSSSKHSSSSSKDKHSSSSSSDKDRHRDKSKESGSRDKDRHRSSSDKHKSSSSSGDKHKSSSSSSGDKQKSSSSSDHKERSSSSSKAASEVKVEVKEEVTSSEEANFSSNHTESPVKMTAPTVSPVKKEVTPVKEKVSPVKKEVSPVKEEITPEKKPVVKYDEEESEDEDKPLSVRINESRPKKRPKEESDYEDGNEDDDEDDEDDDDDDIPLSARAKQVKKQKVEKKPPPARNTPVKKEVKKAKAPAKKRKVDDVPSAQTSPTKKKKKEEEEQEVWKWWEEQSEDTGIKWQFLEHKGPVFAPPYEPVPKNVRFYYESKPMELTEATEEVATFYGRMLDHDYTTRDVFNTNFYKDWKKVMTKEEQSKITDMKKCNFVEYNDYFKKKSEERKAMSKEEKQRIKKENEATALEYGFCVIDHHKEKIGNFKIEPPGLFRGRGDHPKQGMLKRRVVPEDVIINCSKDSNVPKAPVGRKWKEVRHDNSVTWLASWTENIQGATKYVMLNAASKLKGQKDWQKYEVARKLHKCVDKIRANYQEDWKSKEMRVRQRSVALYFIDKLALRAGNEKDGEESADTVGCCSLRVEHISLHESKDGKSYVVEFDFLGKDSIRYQNSIPVEKRVFKNLQLFVENKAPEDDLFDRLNTTILNKHLQDLMEGLTAKVFRTYNASRTLSEQLELLTDNDEQLAAKLLSYNRANRAVAILCNHQRAVPKSFDKSMENLQKKIDAKNADIKSVKKDIKGIKADYKQAKSVKTKTLYEKKKKALARLEEQLTKLEVQATDKDENKEIALGTSKLNYLDPRISVAWCKKFDVPVEKVYNKTQRDKFRWALDMATEHFKF